MTGPNSRTGRQAAFASFPTPALPSPHAALLIDFDNVTMGIRSDLTKELKALLASDIIRGKVTVQRAYADWRRYPQYVMPLTERSIDMIWAAAVGSTKKNATDIRLAIDAMELVFTRPEIGTFIILSGDSDFSSLVRKMKEYGKYVIGIGIRDSASDLLIETCDEYYSYSDLAGLNKEVQATTAQRDPWELCRDAVAQMVRQGDVMRSDRLKQVMQQIDPNFDERNAGFNRFSKFVTDAAGRGLITATKLDNGQYEIAPVPGHERAMAAGSEAAKEGDEAGRRKRNRGRGRDWDRGRKERRDEVPAAAAGSAPPAQAAQLPLGPVDQLTLGGAFALVTRALTELPTPARHEALLARMVALHGREDPLLDPARFPRLLRQANDAEIAEVKKIGEDAYEISMSRVERARAGGNSPGYGSAAGSPPATVESAERAREPGSGESDPAADLGARPAMLRFRRGSRTPLRPQEIPTVGMIRNEPDEAVPAVLAAAVAQPTVDKPAKAAVKARPGRAKGGAAAKAPPVAPAPVVVAKAPNAARGQPRRGRARTAKVA